MIQISSVRNFGVAVGTENKRHCPLLAERAYYMTWSCQLHYKQGAMVAERLSQDLNRQTVRWNSDAVIRLLTSITHPAQSSTAISGTYFLVNQWREIGLTTNNSVYIYHLYSGHKIKMYKNVMQIFYMKQQLYHKKAEVSATNTTIMNNKT